MNSYSCLADKAKAENLGGSSARLETSVFFSAVWAGTHSVQLNIVYRCLFVFIGIPLNLHKCKVDSCLWPAVVSRLAVVGGQCMGQGGSRNSVAKRINR